MTRYLQVDLLAKNFTLDSFFEFHCGCEVHEIHVNRFAHFSSFIDSIRNPLLSDRKSGIKNLVSKMIFTLKILIKRPDLLNPYKMNQKSYLLMGFGEDHEHTFPKDDFWISENLDVFGYSQPLDRHDHALSAVRDSSIQGFMFQHKVKEAFEKSSEKSDDFKSEHLSHVSIPQKFSIGEWKSTSFFQFEGATTFSGLYASCSTLDYVYTCGYIDLRTEVLAKKPNFNLFPENLIKIEGGAVLLAFSRNLYHFICEGIRPLIYCLENNINFELIILRSDTPLNFVNILRSICPEKEILLQDKSDIFHVDRLVVAQSFKSFASLEGSFGHLSSIDFSEWDEFRTLSFCRNFFSVDLPDKKGSPLISVRSKTESRGFINANFLQMLLRMKSFPSIDFAQIEFENLRKELNSTGVLVCEAGAGIINFIFLPRNAHLIEINYGNGESWEGILRHFDVRYHSVRIFKIQYGLWGKRFDIYFYPTTRLLVFLNRIIRQNST